MTSSIFYLVCESSCRISDMPIKPIPWYICSFNSLCLWACLLCAYVVQDVREDDGNDNDDLGIHPVCIS